MNTETGYVYRSAAEIAEAMQRGEQLAMVSERVANAVEIGTRVLDRKAKKAKRKMAKRSRKQNRRR